MTLTWNRILSGLLALCYIITAFAADGGEIGCKVILGVILPLACIWFGDAMGGYTGPAGSIWINATSPGIMVQIVGWLVLLLPVFSILIAVLSKL